MTLPKTVFKYFPDKLYGFQFLKSGLLGHPLASGTNDPLEFSFVNLKSIFGDLPDELGIPYRSTGLLAEFHNNYLDKRYAVLCLSRRWNNFMMWAHYASNHRGFCVGFDSTHEFFHASEASTGLTRVNYSRSRIAIDTDNEENAGAITRVFTTKPSEWKEEEEYRVVVDFIKRQPQKLKQISNNQHILLYHVPASAIVDVTLGFHASLRCEQRIMNLARRIRVPVFRAKLTSDSLKLRRELLYKP